MVFEGYCKDAFWDGNLTWRTEYTGNPPDFTDCFQKTVLAWTPCIFLWIVALFEWLYANNYFQNHKSQLHCIRVWSLTFKLRLLIQTLLISTQVVLLVKNAADSRDPVDIYTYAIRSSTFLLAVCLCIHSQAKKRQASGVQSVFWFLTAACEAFAFRSHLMNGVTEEIGRFEWVIAIVFYVLVVVQLILNSFGEPKLRNEHAKSESKTNKPCPEPRASLWSRPVFFWFDRIVWNGFWKPLQHSDLYNLNPEDKSNALDPKFAKEWASASAARSGSQNEDKSSNSKALLRGSEANDFQMVSIRKILWKMFWPVIIYGSCTKMIQDGLSFVHPEVIKYLFAFVDNTEAEWKGYVYALTLFFTTIAQTLLLAQYYSSVYMVGLRIRTVLTNAIYRKALRMSNANVNVGQVIDLVTFDVQVIIDFLSYMDFVWSIPLHVIVSFYFLWKDFFGPSVLAGFGLIIVLLPLQFIIAHKLKGLNARMLKLKDSRLKLTTDLFTGIKTVKLNVLEDVLANQIVKIREKEVQTIKYILLLNFTSDLVVGLIPVLSTAITFITFVLVDDNNVLDASRAFLGLIYFAYISFPLSFIPSFITKYAQAKVSLRRVTVFMNSEQIQSNLVTEAELKEDALVMENSSFSWNVDATPALSNINLRIKKGSLVGIVGPRGSGKSSLLHAILGEMYKTSGSISRETDLKISYSAQQPWIQNATVKNNIVFSSLLNEYWYNNVVQACTLKPDLKCLPAGDQTEIGEKGSTLSGGQKSRIALARAVYCNADLYLLDDPLSAVDSFVGKSLFDNVIGRSGLLKNKTRIIVTNQTAHFAEFDCIVYLKDGEVVEVGSLEELLNKKGAFAEYISFHNSDQDQSNKAKRNSVQFTQSSKSEDPDPTTTEVLEPTEDKCLLDDGQLMEVEQAQIGIVKFGSYFTYVNAIGWLALMVMVLHFGTQLLSFFSNRWLTKWTEDADPDATRDYYLGGYTGFALSVTLVAFLMGITLVHGSIRASLTLHCKMLNCVLKCPMWFFDTNPIGRIMNRFSGDMAVCDTLMASNMKLFFGGFITIGFQVYVITSVTPEFIYVIIPAFVIFTLLQRFYMTTWRHATRLEAVNKSPVLAWINETLHSSASTTIRAHSMELHFVEEMKRKVDHNQVPAFAITVFRRSLKMRVDMLSNVMFLSAAIFTVWGRDRLSSGLVGLAITYAREMGGNIVSMMQWLSDMETNVVSMERIKEYTELESESSDSSDYVGVDSRSSRNWPESGTVTFSHFEAHYRKRPQPVLQNVHLHIESGQKICIVGRTGAGKSSLALTLFKIIERTRGSIEIDGRNISTLNLAQLRRGLNIVPQDPALFNGTFRSNLDPFQEYTDAMIWRSLELAHVKHAIESFSNGLDHKVEAGSTEILSMGQLQLFYLARALLRKSKILILDEATSAIDLETDKKIQQVILTEFGESTVIAICHRLNHIVGYYEKVLVMGNGEIIEFDSPETLARDSNSIFFSMMQAASLAR